MTESTTEETVAQYPTQAPARPRRRRRRRGGWVTLLAVLLVLATLAVIGDRVAASVADNKLRDRIITQLDSRNIGYDSLDVSIGGFPFLAEVARGQYEKISIDMTGVHLRNAVGPAAGVELRTLNAVAGQVEADTADLINGRARVLAQTVDGTAVMSYQTLQSLVDFSGYHLSEVVFSESGGALVVTAKVSLAGLTAPISAVADIAVAGGQLQITLREVKALSVTAPQAVKDYLGGLVSRGVTARLPQLPFGLALQRVSVGPDGLAVTAGGRNVGLVG